MEISWQQFGLKSDPYDTNALAEGGDFLLNEVFVGREKERSRLDGIFSSEDRACLTICGDPGVGKTSLTNFQKFEWKYNRVEKPLFSFRGEIEISEILLDKQYFLFEIMASLLREIELIDPDLLKEKLLADIHSLVTVTQRNLLSRNMSVNVGVFSGGVSNEDIQTTPQRMTTIYVEKYFMDLLSFIQNNKIGGMEYRGIIVHVNNFDTLLQEKGKEKAVVTFFHEMRNLLQTKGVYFLFLGPEDFYSAIIATQDRVRSVFAQTPLIVKPLSKKEVTSAFEKRMHFLRSDRVLQHIRPVDDTVIFALYDLYDGDIRNIMQGVKDILGQCGDRIMQSVSKEQAKRILSKKYWEEGANDISKTIQEVLLFFMGKDPECLTNTQIAKELKKAQANISKYIKVLKDRNIIEEKRTQGKSVFYGITTAYKPLIWRCDYNAENKAQEMELQESLFTQ
jgi:DNA-binding transcriptional ArsR family regulator/GTPase SAR1 family protein